MSENKEILSNPEPESNPPENRMSEEIEESCNTCGRCIDNNCTVPGAGPCQWIPKNNLNPIPIEDMAPELKQKSQGCDNCYAKEIDCNPVKSDSNPCWKPKGCENCGLYDLECKIDVTRMIDCGEEKKDWISKNNEKSLEEKCRDAEIELSKPDMQFSETLIEMFNRIETLESEIKELKKQASLAENNEKSLKIESDDIKSIANSLELLSGCVDEKYLYIRGHGG